MSPRTEEQNRYIREERKKQILEAGMIQFADKGFEATTMQEVATKAGIAKGSVYQYFKSKEELLQNILNKGIEELIKYFDPNNDGVIENDELIYFIESTIQHLKDNREFWKLYFRMGFQPEIMEYLRPKIEMLYDNTMKMLSEFLAEKGFENPEQEALLFGTILDGLSFDYILQPDLYPLESMKNILIEKYCK